MNREYSIRQEQKMFSISTQWLYLLIDIFFQHFIFLVEQIYGTKFTITLVLITRSK